MSQEKRESNTEVAVEKKPVRPLLVVSDKNLSEYEMFVYRLLVGLADESVPAALISLCGWEIEPVVPPSIEVIKHPAFGLPFLRHQANKELLERLVDFKPTVLHSLCEQNAFFVKRLAHQLDLPYILTVNSLQKQFSRLFLFSRHPASITVPAKSISESIRKVRPKYAGQIKQINIGTFLEGQGGCFSELSRQICMVTAGAFKEVSEFKNLLGAVRRLALDGYEFMLFIIGKGPAEKKLRRLITALGLSQMITIVPRLQPWRSFLSACDIFICPRPSNSFNPLLLEAMSTGTAVASCKGGVDDLIIENETAVIFEADDELSIMNRLRELLNRPERSRQLAEAAQNYVKENHKVSTMVSEMLQVYRDVQKPLEV